MYTGSVMSVVRVLLFRVFVMSKIGPLDLTLCLHSEGAILRGAGEGGR